MRKDLNLSTTEVDAVEQIKAGKPLFGKNGVLAQFVERIVNAVLEGEMDAHLTEEEREYGNRRNGKMQKKVKTPLGDITVSTPRDRDATFDPQFIKKRETILAEGVAENIIGLYSLGTSTREISDWVEKTVGSKVTPQTISAITDRVIPEMEKWKNRPLQNIYPIAWLDAIHYNVQDEHGRPVSRAIYNVLAINREGQKEVIGMYVSKSEGANFWLQVLSDLKNRGVEDFLIVCVDGLKGFPEAIKAEFPKAKVQLCIVHQIRNSIKYVASKDKREFIKDLKAVYQAVNKDAADENLHQLEEKWGEKYPIVTKSWREKWETLSEYFQFTPEIRRLIYTTNAVEGYHRQLRKVTKNKGVFPTDTSLEKLIYLAYRNISKKWGSPIRNWALISQQLAITFEDRFTIL